jgi:integrase
MASLTKRGDTFRIMVSLGYGLDGKQIRKTTTFTPPKNVTEGKAKKLAEAYAHDFEKKCRGVSDLGENMRFHELAEWYYREIAPNVVRGITIYNQQLLIKLYALDEFGHMKLKDISTARLDELWNRLKRNGGHREYYALIDTGSIPIGTRRETAKAIGVQESLMYRLTSGGRVNLATAEKISAALGKKVKELFYLGSEKGGLSAATVNRVKAAVSAIFNTAVRKGMMEKNPVANTTPPKIEYTKKPFLDASQCKRLLDILDEQDNPQLKTAITALLYTGLRSGELLALRWEDMDFANASISVNKTLTLLRGEYSFTPPKTKSSERKVKAPPELMALLKAHKIWQAERRLAFGGSWENSGQVFTNEKGGFYNRTTLNQQFKRLLKKNGLPDLHIHDLRHANASLLINAGLPANVVSEHLGHHNTQTTLNTYAHAFDETKAKAAEIISLALGK